MIGALLASTLCQKASAEEVAPAVSQKAPDAVAPSTPTAPTPSVPQPSAAKPSSGPPAANPPAKPAQQTGTSAVVMDLSSIEGVIGHGVKSSAGEDMGRIVDLLVTMSGQVRAAVIDFGGILGVGSRKVAVDWRALDFSELPKGGDIRLLLTRNQVRVSPEYKSGEPIVILEAAKPTEVAPNTPAPTSANASTVMPKPTNDTKPNEAVPAPTSQEPVTKPQ